MTLTNIIRAIQAKEGLHVDGFAGPQTWLAIHRHYFPDSAVHRPAEPDIPEGGISLVDERSEKAIATLHPEVRPMARALVNAAVDQGINIKVTSGTRTYAEQNALYAQGRSKPGKVVTNARGGQSNHNFGLAFDVTLFSGATPVWESPLYKVVGSIGQSLGLEWGGSWKSLKDEPHFEMVPTYGRDLSSSQRLAIYRTRHDSGKDLFA